MKSIWSEMELPAFPKLQQDITTDVLIVGGGMAGILLAYYLHQNNVDYVLAEKDGIGCGTTKNTTAKITAQHGLIYHKLAQNYGLELARKYLDANLLACKEYKRLCENIACDYEVKNNFVYSVSDKQILIDEMATLDKLHFESRYADDLPIPIDTVGAVEFPNQAQFHPYKFLAKIAKDLHVYEHTFVKKVEKNVAITDGGTIRADNIVIATHFPFINTHGAYFLKLYQHRSYVIAIKPGEQVDGMYVDENNLGYSFRNQGDMLLLGGGGHRTGKPGGGWEELRTFAKHKFPDASEKFHWAAQDCMSLDDIPYIGKYGRMLHGVYVATGFHKWGMTSSMVAAQILTDEILGKSNEYADVFLPQRSMMTKQLFINIGEATCNLLTPSKRRCSHMGCALKWNEQEHTWDCPCHGSRYTENGTLLQNPSQKGLILK